MVKEKIKKALEDAVGYYNDGLSANEAIVKAAADHDLTVDQTDRVVESFNTAKTINFFDKNAGDRTGKFELASKKDVTLSLFGKVEEKKASIAEVSDPDSINGSFYFSAPDRSLNRKNVFAEKRAAYLDKLASEVEEKWAHGYSDHTFHAMASDAYQTVKAAEADIDSALGTIDSYLWTATMKIASELSKNNYDSAKNRADLFKVACPHKMVVDEVSKICPILKSATGGVYSNTPVVDTSSIDDLLKEADDIVEAVAQRREYRQKKAEFAKKAEKLKDAIISDPSISQKVASAAKPEALIHRPASFSKQAAMSFPIVSPLGEPVTKFIVGSTNDENKKLKDENEKLRDETRGAILADLLSSDPILQDADPRQIAAVYKSIISSSPRVSLNKEVVRSVLRGAVNSIAFSPNDMKVLTDVDLGINKAYNLSRLDSSVKDSAP